MRLSQATDYHSTVTLAGLMQDGTWDPEVVRGSLMPYGQVISARSFGVMMRLFQTTDDNISAGGYYVVRLPTGTKFLVKSHNEDINTRVYKHTYLLLEVTHSVEIISLHTAQAANGMPSGTDEVLETVVWGNMERISAETSDISPAVKYTGMVLSLPGDTWITTDHTLRIGDQGYDVTEVWETSLLKQARVSKRGAH
jgi:hypothetical protein